MKILLRFSLLVLLCQLTFTSCQKSNSKTLSQFNPPERNTTLSAVNPDPAVPVFNTIATQQSHNSIEKMLHKEAPQKQKFTANITEPIVVNCEQGTVLKFEPNVFVYADSKLPVTEPVEIQVTEYLDYASILFSDLSTTSGKEILETGGMIYVEAVSNGRACEIKDGEYYEIELPAEINKDKMQLFYGQSKDGKIDWYAANRGSYMESQNYNTAQNWADNKIPVITKPAYDGGYEAMYAYLNKRVYFPDWTQNIELKAKCYVNFMLNTKGEVKKVFTSATKKTYADKDVVAAFKDMPAWKVPQSMKKGDVKRLIVPINLEWVKNPSKMPVKLKVESKPEGEQFNATFETDKYLMSSAKLGWINCDRFVDKPVRTELFVQVDSTYDATVRIVFKNYKTVLGGLRYTKGFTFANVPMGEEVTIIAMRNNNGHYELAMKDCLITGLPIKDLEFIPADKEMMETKFNQLQKSLNDNTAQLMQPYINPLKLLNG